MIVARHVDAMRQRVRGGYGSGEAGGVAVHAAESVVVHTSMQGVGPDTGAFERVEVVRQHGLTAVLMKLFEEAESLGCEAKSDSQRFDPATGHSDHVEFDHLAA